MTETVESAAGDAGSVQERFAPRCRCFGCGPANDRGLRLRSYLAANGEELLADYQPQPHHIAYDGMLNGGVIGALLDCHSNWTAALALMRRDGAPEPPCTVTAEFTVKLAKPTPLAASLRLAARAVELQGRRVIVEATLGVGHDVTATCRGTFVAVKEGHPAFHRW